MGGQGRKKRRTRSDDAYADPRSGGATGLGDFEHNQWTFEGEVERLGAFATGARRAGGWKLVVAWVVAAAFLLPLLIWFVQLAWP